MTTTTALWVGLAAGGTLGTALTWITLGLGVALGRHLHHRAAATSQPAPETREPAPDTGLWPTLDTDHARLIERERGKQ